MKKTIAQLSSDYGVHPNQIGMCKKKLLAGLPLIFDNKSTGDNNELESELYRQIGQLKVELDWLKKKSQMLKSRKNACS